MSYEWMTDEDSTDSDIIMTSQFISETFIRNYGIDKTGQGLY